MQVTLLLGIPVIALSMVPPLQFTNWQWLALTLAAPVAVWGAWPFHRAAAINLRHGTATMDTLISLGVLAAFGWSLYALFFGGAGHEGMRHGFSLTVERGSAGQNIYLEVASGLTAAILAVFVIGTSPLFAILGYAARKATTLWRGRLVAATGIVVVALGLYTLNGGLELAGSPLAASRILEAASGTAAADPTSTTVKDGHQEVVITATDSGYNPRAAAITAGIPTTLIVRSEGASGCVRAFVIHDTQTVLPESGDTRIDLGTPTAGTLRYACGMGMFTGVITIT